MPKDEMAYIAYLRFDYNEHEGRHYHNLISLLQDECQKYFKSFMIPATHDQKIGFSWTDSKGAPTGTPMQSLRNKLQWVVDFEKLSFNFKGMQSMLEMCIIRTW